MYRIIILSLFIAILASCGEADKVPNGVLPKEKMRDVLLDMQTADAYSVENGETHAPLPDSIREKRVKLYYRQILDLHHLTLAEFDSSFHFYESHPDRMKEVYDMMLVIATADRETLDRKDRSKTYFMVLSNFLPYARNAILSGTADTVIPFVKKRKVIPAR